MEAIFTFDEIGEFVIFAKFRLNLVNNIHCFVIVLQKKIDWILG